MFKKSVNKLLSRYKDYLTAQAAIDLLDNKRMAAAASLAKEKGLKISDILKGRRNFEIFTALDNQEAKLRAQLQEISDSMTFANPIIWLMYKYLAYQGTGSAILNLKDLKKHCAKPGYICTKRFDYLNNYLKSAGLANLIDTVKFPDNLKMPELYESNLLNAAVSDENFMAGWHKYEFFQDGNRIAKWENYFS